MLTMVPQDIMKIVKIVLVLGQGPKDDVNENVGINFTKSKINCIKYCCI